jgi:bis(5'-nucleosyl)-tetraphosphatase (symmetrical)
VYGDSPHTWHRDLEEKEACRYTINACMRMRFCRADGTLEFKHKMGQNTAPTDFKASLRVYERGVGETLACGSGACATVAYLDLIGKVNAKDSGALNMIRFKDKQIFSVAC